MSLTKFPFQVYRGDDWEARIGQWLADGGVTTDTAGTIGASITAADDQLILPTGVQIRGNGTPRDFNDDDVGQMVTLLAGTEIADGTTITAVAPDGRSATLSADATGTRTADAAVIVRARNMSTFTFDAHVRATQDGPKLFELPVITSRLAYGVLHFQIHSEARRTILTLGVGSLPDDPSTDILPSGGTGDIQAVETATGLTATPIEFTVTLSKDWTHT